MPKLIGRDLSERPEPSLSMHQVSKPRSVNHSITDECGRPGTCRSKVGCEAIDEPCTKRIVPLAALPALLRQRKSLMSPLRVQCSVPFIGGLMYPGFYARIRRPSDRGGSR